MIDTNYIKSDVFFENALNELILNDERRNVLIEIAQFITSELKNNKAVNLNFICTHNSRRSQLSQVWAHFAIDYFNLQNIYSFSGGTEATSFFSNTVKTLQETGFQFQIKDFSHQNPVYQIISEKMYNPIIGFSKIYDDTINQKPFIAITTCNNADENCPYIADALKRFHLPFVDPKASDKSPNTLEVYKKTSKIIAGEIGFILRNVKEQLS